MASSDGHSKKNRKREADGTDTEGETSVMRVFNMLREELRVVRDNTETLQEQVERLTDQYAEIKQLQESYIATDKTVIAPRYTIPTRVDAPQADIRLRVSAHSDERDDHEEEILARIRLIYPIVSDNGLVCSVDPSKHAFSEECLGWSDPECNGHGVFVGGDSNPLVHQILYWYPELFENNIPFFNLFADGKQMKSKDVLAQQLNSSSVLLTLSQAEVIKDNSLSTIAQLLFLVTTGHCGLYVASNGPLNAVHYDNNRKQANCVGCGVTGAFTDRDRMLEVFWLVENVFGWYETWARETGVACPTRLFNSIVSLSDSNMKSPRQMFARYNRTLCNKTPEKYVDDHQLSKWVVAVSEKQFQTDAAALLQVLFVGSFLNRIPQTNWNLLFGDAHEMGHWHARFRLMAELFQKEFTAATVATVIPVFLFAAAYKHT